MQQEKQEVVKKNGKGHTGRDLSKKRRGKAKRGKNISAIKKA